MVAAVSLGSASVVTKMQKHHRVDVTGSLLVPVQVVAAYNVGPVILLRLGEHETPVFNS
jgi:hypothetical protein